MPLPGGYRRGTLGADAECDSMRTVGGGEFSGRTPAGTPEEATYRQSSVRTPESQTPPATDASQAASALKPATTKAGKPRVRMKWDSEINTFIMRTYFQITNLETDLTQYRPMLLQRFLEKYPDANVSEQRLSDQRRAIVRNKFLSDAEIDQIKHEVQSALDVNTNHTHQTLSQNPTTNVLLHQNTQTTINQNSLLLNTTETSQENYDTLTNTAYSQTQQIPDPNPQTFTDTQLIDILRDNLETNLLKYKGTDPGHRPKLPRLKTTRELSRIISIFNQEILPHKLTEIENIVDTHTFIYCTALTIVTHLQIKIKTRTNRPKTNKPAWQMRLETDIEQLRKDIGRLTQFKNGNKAKKLVQKVKAILEKTKTHSKYDDPNKKLDEHLDTLKQKLAIKSHRLNRYKKSQSRKQNNKLFSTNEKQFYRQFKQNTNVDQPPTAESLEEFWGNIWSNSVEHNQNAEWISNEKARSDSIPEMQFDDINVDEITAIINKTHNWKAAGVDSIQNFWFKKLYPFHEILAKQISDILKGNSVLPEFLTKGITFMLPKSSKTQDPSQYRPITCLPTLYKIITSCITHRINEHIELNNILSEEQKGCRKFHRGCKEQLIIDSTVLKYSQKHKKDIFISYIDYKKAFDSIPHSWLLEILEIYKINPKIIEFLKNTMTSWRTTINLRSSTNDISTGEVYIKRGIYQGDSLSPLWFCLALNPLSNELNESKMGFNIKCNRLVKHQITHLLYMDDLKLYADKVTNMSGLLDKTTEFSRDIKMDLGLDKCKKLNIVKGKIVVGDYSLGEEECIAAMKKGEIYKYLGYNQARLIEHREIKEKLKTEYYQRIHSLCKKQLYSKNLFKAINTYAIPILTYSFGVIKWTNSELQALEIKTRTILTQHRYHHPKSAVERITLPRKEGGRGLIEISHLHKKQILNLKEFFNEKQANNKNFTPLNLSNEATERIDTAGLKEAKLKRWREKELHGRHPHDLDQVHIDPEASNKWLESGQLFPESEGFLIAIQDQVISTKNYRKYILKDRTLRNDLCRKCNNKPETIQHITGACITLTQNDYTHRHNQLVNIIHQKLVLKYKLLNDHHTPYYKYTPQNVIENPKYKLYYDRTILTDNTIYNNRPDITFVDKDNKHTYIIDIAVPNTNNIQSTIIEKVRKYTELQDQIKRLLRHEGRHVVWVG
ncbi:hypothetical protein ABMA28_014906 [Loxostege sticticalis]|uniref:Reverse transcriptase domain-containing protein n=1 Tax=Loxostege sticticalis TaxID=481309 RepID=A0ABD0TCP5_LOXSC